MCRIWSDVMTVSITKMSGAIGEMNTQNRNISAVMVRYVMSRYINYDALDYRNDKMHDKSSDFIDGVIYMAQRIEDAPSIDIVRCKECKYYEAKEDWCYWRDEAITADDFCSYGERKESE